LKIRFTPQAVADLDEIRHYLSDDLSNPQAATTLISLVFRKIQTLSTLPQTGARLRTAIPALKTYRFIPCGNYLVFYRAEEQFVSIVRILHAKRDYLGLIEPDQTDTITDE